MNDLLRLLEKEAEQEKDFDINLILNDIKSLEKEIKEIEGGKDITEYNVDTQEEIIKILYEDIEYLERMLSDVA